MCGWGWLALVGYLVDELGHVDRCDLGRLGDRRGSGGDGDGGGGGGPVVVGVGAYCIVPH